MNNPYTNIQIEQRLINIEALLIGAKRVLTFNDLASYTGLSKSYLYKLTSTSQIPHSKPNGKHIYFDKEEIDSWLLRNKIQTADLQNNAAATYVTLKPHK